MNMAQSVRLTRSVRAMTHYQDRGTSNGLAQNLPQHRLCFFPLPHGHGALRGGRRAALERVPCERADPRAGLTSLAST
jgi:hypothetical protein